MSDVSRKKFAQYWQPVAWYGVLLLLLAGLLWYRLGTLTPGFSGDEAVTLQGSDSWRYIFHHPVDAPFHALGRLLLYINHHGLLMMRWSTALLGLATVSIFYWLVRHWHGERAAIIGTVLFGSSAWLLHTARLGVPDVLLFSILSLITVNIWLRRRPHWPAVLVAFVLVSTLLYVPGMLWLIVLGAMWQWRTLDKIFKRNLWAVSLGALILLAAVTPLGLAIYHDHSVGRIIAGLPAQGWPMPLDILHRLISVPVNLLLHGPLGPEHWLGRLPVLDFFTMAMAGLGVFLYARHPRMGRVQMVALALLAGTLLISLGGAVTLTLILPFFYLLAGVGADFMLGRWFGVFPRNVIAQSVGVGLITLAVLATCWYSLRHYFVAWPQAPATKTVFTLPEQIVSSGTIKR